MNSQTAQLYVIIEEQGGHNGESTRLPPMWPRVDLRQVLLWTEFVVGSQVASMVFSLGSLVFLPSQKPTLSNSDSATIEALHENQLRLT